MSDALFSGTPVTLTDMLQARENRSSLQRELLAADEKAALLVATMNIPGPVKNSAPLTAIFEELITEIEEAVKELIPLANLYRSLETGPEYYLVLPTDPYELKRMMVQIETHHPYGRLVDLDVLAKTQDQLLPISRTEIGLPARSCYICEQDAKVCGRSRTHSVADMQQQIRKIIQERVKE
ncbi:citrate lyase holo-[acyl-carrier protein] synthase [Enterococcus casseliflavus]|nr:citrate lyase holo-[acyl-carrier protein] synthase [Enterococcus casseliflavus]MDB1692882.1 citrate lyase holo-[acyl-carrier protein] synthase [Enterococcus casseliflavus]